MNMYFENGDCLRAPEAREEARKFAQGMANDLGEPVHLGDDETREEDREKFDPEWGSDRKRKQESLRPLGHRQD
jgi:hypothetical protein